MSNLYEVRFSPNQKLPPGYRIMRDLDDGHYQWFAPDGDESFIDCRKWAVYRGAWQHYRIHGRGGSDE